MSSESIEGVMNYLECDVRSSALWLSDNFIKVRKNDISSTFARVKNER